MSLFLHKFLDILQGHLVSVMTDSKLAGKKSKAEYSGTPLKRTPTEPAQVSVLTGCPY